MMEPKLVNEFVVGTSGHLRKVYDTGHELDIAKGKVGVDYVTVVPTDLWREAKRALVVMRALEQLGINDISDALQQRTQENAA